MLASPWRGGFGTGRSTSHSRADTPHTIEQRPMIKLTRLRQNTPFILNPDHIERIDTHVDTVVKLTSGNEYLVNETGEDIVRMTIEYRALVLASAGRLAVADHAADDDLVAPADLADHRAHVEAVEPAPPATAEPVTEDAPVADDATAEEVAS